MVGETAQPAPRRFWALSRTTGEVAVTFSLVAQAPLAQVGLEAVLHLRQAAPPGDMGSTSGATGFDRGTDYGQVVDWLTHSQLRRHLGALPVLYALLEVLQVREIINRHCPTICSGRPRHSGHGADPQPVGGAPTSIAVADWLARTVLVYTLGVPAEKFNDDRLARTLDAISEHSRDIWQDVVHRALVQAEIDLSIIFYDLTAFVVHGSLRRQPARGLWLRSQHADGQTQVQDRVECGRRWQRPHRVCAVVRANSRHGYCAGEYGAAVSSPEKTRLVGEGDDHHRRPGQPERRIGHRLRRPRLALSGRAPTSEEGPPRVTGAVPDQQFYACTLEREGGYWGICARCSSSTKAGKSLIGDWWCSAGRCAPLYARRGPPS